MIYLPKTGWMLFQYGAMEKTRRAIKLGQAVCILLYSEACSLVLPDCIMFLKKKKVFYRIKIVKTFILNKLNFFFTELASPLPMTFHRGTFNYLCI